MNTDIIKGQWKQMKGKVKERWGQLTDDQLNQMDGKKDQIVGEIQKTYGKTREEAEREYNEFMKK